jgi:hypothetical protein
MAKQKKNKGVAVVDNPMKMFIFRQKLYNTKHFYILFKFGFYQNQRYHCIRRQPSCAKTDRKNDFNEVL